MIKYYFDVFRLKITLKSNCYHTLKHHQSLKLELYQNEPKLYRGYNTLFSFSLLLLTIYIDGC
jgi:hypothetical protein